jgi:hypothetical protein
MVEKEERKKWRNRIRKCSQSAQGVPRGLHDWIPISKHITKSSEHVSMLMCKWCFARVNIEEIYANTIGPEGLEPIKEEENLL